MLRKSTIFMRSEVIKMNKGLIVFLLFIFCLFLSPVLKSSVAYAQDSSSSGSVSDDTSSDVKPESGEEILAKVLQDLNSVYEKLLAKKIKSRRVKAKQVLSISRQFDRAVNSTPPSKCTLRLKAAIRDFYGIVSKLGQGIACGPPILIPFDRFHHVELNPDCLPPPDGISTDQLDSGFIELNPIYDKARRLSIIDNDENDVPDVCEGK